MKIYHGTSERNLDSIMTQGVIPRLLSHVPPTSPLLTNDHACFLTSVFPSFYAWERCQVDNCARAVIIEIDMDRLNQYHFDYDELMLEEFSKSHDQFELSDPKEYRLAFYINLINKGKIKHLPWRNSLDFMGTCSYMDIIPCDAMTRIALVDLHHCRPLVDDFRGGTISYVTFRKIKYRYEQLLKWIMDGENPPEALLFSEPTISHLPKTERAGIEFLENS